MPSPTPAELAEERSLTPAELLLENAVIEESAAVVVAVTSPMTSSLKHKKTAATERQRAPLNQQVVHALIQNTGNILQISNRGCFNFILVEKEVCSLEELYLNADEALGLKLKVVSTKPPKITFSAASSSSLMVLIGRSVNLEEVEASIVEGLIETQLGFCLLEGKEQLERYVVSSFTPACKY